LSTSHLVIKLPQPDLGQADKERSHEGSELGVIAVALKVLNSLN
jgi:hypothetical protein